MWTGGKQIRRKPRKTRPQTGTLRRSPIRQLEYQSQAGPIVLDWRKAAYLPDCETLLVADLHFEKGSFLQAAGGAPLPTYDTVDTLDRLSALIKRFAPRHIISLGDSFHDVHAGHRMRAEDFDAINALTRSVERFTWILGNHDPDIPQGLLGEREDHVECDGFLLTHLPTPPFRAGGVNICGHLHPKLRIKTRRSNLWVPCWAVSQDRIIMPSFGTFTGGLDVIDPAIADELTGERAFFAIAQNQIVALGG
jgi:hypothetical protein